MVGQGGLNCQYGPLQGGVNLQAAGTGGTGRSAVGTGGGTGRPTLVNNRLEHTHADLLDTFTVMTYSEDPSKTVYVFETVSKDGRWTARSGRAVMGLRGMDSLLSEGTGGASAGGGVSCSSGTVSKDCRSKVESIA